MRVQKYKRSFMRRILITNDDGIESDGLRRLAEAAADFGEVWVVAPESQRSAASHCVTLHTAIDVSPCGFPVKGVHAYASSGMPADCVRVGALYVMPHKPDVVLTGINYGYNAATDVQYSATVGAAMEGAFQGCRAIALSEGALWRHEVTDHYLHEVLEELIDESLGYGQIFNVNFPCCALSVCRGILRDRTVSHGMMYRDSYRLQKRLPDGGFRLMVDGEYNEDAEPGTDFRAIVDRYVSIGVVSNIG